MISRDDEVKYRLEDEVEDEVKNVVEERTIHEAAPFGQGYRLSRSAQFMRPAKKKARCRIGGLDFVEIEVVERPGSQPSRTRSIVFENRITCVAPRRITCIAPSRLDRGPPRSDEEEDEVGG